MDLGIIAPAAIATGVGLLRGRAWARKTMYVMFTGYSCLAISVAAMGIVMNLHSDPDASPAVTGGFVILALVFVTLTVVLYRPVFRESHAGLDSVRINGGTG